MDARPIELALAGLLALTVLGFVAAALVWLRVLMERCVPFVRTSIDQKTYARALVAAWRALLGSDPTKGQAGVLWAQYGIETGAGPFCWNWNIGNVKHVTGDGHEWMMLPNTWEMERGKRVVYQPPHPATWFRSFPDLDTAMVEHFAFLHGKRYAPAWEGVELEDCGLFARLLKQGGLLHRGRERLRCGDARPLRSVDALHCVRGGARRARRAERRHGRPARAGGADALRHSTAQPGAGRRTARRRLSSFRRTPFQISRSSAGVPSGVTGYHCITTPTALLTLSRFVNDSISALVSRSEWRSLSRRG